MLNLPEFSTFPMNATFRFRPFARRWVWLAAVLAAGCAGAEEAAAPARWWSDAAEQAIGRADANGGELRRALREVPEAQRPSLQFLVENMPEQDLHRLPADFLLRDVAQAAEARAQAPWAGTMPEDIFLNDVLPYANASEQRDSWRAELREKCLPMIEGCTTPAAAAQALNEKLFPAVKVRYSTGRARADQSPSETMSSGTASCTGLSILLVDACRAVGVPARLVGIPDWSDGRGNHTWVEVWDAGKWHFAGAAEPDKQGLDHAWFEHDAALAQKDSPRHAIYAVSFRRTGVPFPLAWGPDSGGISAENVTDRYAAAKPAAATAAAAPATARVMFRVRANPEGPRVAAVVHVTGVDQPDVDHYGETKGETADTNDMLAFDLPKDQGFALTADENGRHLQKSFHTGSKDQEMIEVAFDPAAGAAPATASADAPSGPPTDPAAALHEALTRFYAAAPEQQATWTFDPRLDTFLSANPASVRRTAWEAFRRAAAPKFAPDFAAKQVKFEGYVSPYTVRAVGTKPAEGWGMVIAMHGGGGTAKEVNDSQWQGMQTYYHDQPQLGGYLYVALRAPNDTWNGFYDDYDYPLVANLLRQFAVCEEMNLNRVYLIGYSHGGYGAFAIGPKEPDRFAAIHSSAAAPTDGLISPKTLRNTAFDFAVGEFDDGYGRRKRCEAFDQQIKALRGPRTDIYPVTFEVQAGKQHGNLADHDQLKEMLTHTRNPVPGELTWEETDGVIKGFFWLEDRQPGKGREIDAACKANRLTISTPGVTGRFSVLLDERLVELNRPLVIEHDGGQENVVLKPSLLTLAQTLQERGDPDLAFTCRVEFEAVDGKWKLGATKP